MRVVLVAAATVLLMRGSEARDTPDVVREMEAAAREAEQKARGYARELPLTAAVAEFNRENERWIRQGTIAELRDSEVIAALLCWNRGARNRRLSQSLADEQYDDAVHEVFQKIASTATMPRGSRFEWISKCTRCISGENVTSTVILLRIGLDRYPADLADVPSYTRQIRRTYSMTGPIKQGQPCAEEPPSE